MRATTTNKRYGENEASRSSKFVNEDLFNKVHGYRDSLQEAVSRMYDPSPTSEDED